MINFFYLQLVGSIDVDCCYYAARIQAQQQPKAKALELIIDLRYMVGYIVFQHWAKFLYNILF
jgi:hypothetical protein